MCTDTNDPTCSNDPKYEECLIGLSLSSVQKKWKLMLPGINRDLITATAAIAGVGSFVFGLLTNLPVALA